MYNREVYCGGHNQTHDLLSRFNRLRLVCVILTADFGYGNRILAFSSNFNNNIIRCVGSCLVMFMV
jgi:hypothetical protein